MARKRYDKYVKKFLLFFAIFTFFFLFNEAKASALGRSCTQQFVTSPTTGRTEEKCSGGSQAVVCDVGFEEPMTCDEYFKTTGDCPNNIACNAVGVSPTTVPTATPTPTAPATSTSSCGGAGQQCCGSIPPLFCNGGLSPSNSGVPGSCMCQAPAAGCGPQKQTIKVDPGFCTTASCPINFQCKTIAAPTALRPGEKLSCDCFGVAGYTPAPTQPPLPTITREPKPPCDTTNYAEWDPTKKVCKKINTGVGPIRTDPAGFIKWFFGFLLGIGGGIALLLIIYSGYKFMTSRGDPEKTKGAKETFTSALVGLIFLIFSMVILQVIAGTILKVPGIE